jgi:hypothetical protein
VVVSIILRVFGLCANFGHFGDFGDIWDFELFSYFGYAPKMWAHN